MRAQYHRVIEDKDLINWKQIINERGKYMYREVNLQNKKEDEVYQTISKISQEIQSDLDIEKGRLMGVVLYHCPIGIGDRLFIVIHHLVVDGVSWRILIDDIEESYGQLIEGKEKIKLGDKSNSYKDWADVVSHYANGDDIKKEIDYWKEVTRKNYKIKREEVLSKETCNIKSYFIEIDDDNTNKLIRGIHNVYRTEIQEILLAALAISMKKWIYNTEDSNNKNIEEEISNIVIDVEGHGREDSISKRGIDLSKTIGWFTSVYPVNIGQDNEEIGEVIKEIKDRIRFIPNKGIGYGILRYVSLNEEIVNDSKREILFNYLGQWGQEKSISQNNGNIVEQKKIFGFSNEGDCGSNISIENSNGYIITINGGVVDGKLKLTIEYDANIIKENKVKKLADLYKLSLGQIIAHCSSISSPQYSSSDFNNIDSDIINEIEKLYEK